MGEQGVERALLLARTLRAAGRTVALDPLPDKSLKAQMRRANDLQVRFALILGESEVQGGAVTLKTMSNGSQETIAEERVPARIEELTLA
jgi:histidyl-tRNA synthetase